MDASPAGTRTAVLTGLRLRLVTPADAQYTALRHAPVVYGRTAGQVNHKRVERLRRVHGIVGYRLAGAAA